jgi:hypothetical protein
MLDSLYFEHLSCFTISSIKYTFQICIAVWDPVIKRGELGSSYQEGRVGIQLSRGESWDPVMKRGELGSSYQEGKVGIQLSRGENWDPVIKRGELGSWYQEGRVGIQLL